MKQTPPNGTAEQHVREIRRRTRKKYSAEEKIRIVIAGLRDEHSIAELCRREGFAKSLYCGGPRRSWRPARNGWPGILSERRRARSRTCFLRWAR